MKRPFLIAALLALAAHAPAQTNSSAQAPTQAKTESSASTLWSSLWRNADQRAEVLLQQGHASDAAKLYTDPRRKAYAQIKAGDYAAAASELKALNDAEAHYNRGNALAQAGDLQGALDAYDAALKQDPSHQDARHNRDLVAKALQKQKDAQKNKPQDGKSQDKPQDGKPQDKKDGNQNGQQNSKPGDQPDKPDSGQGNQPDHKAGEKTSDKPGDKQDAQQASNPNNKPGDKAQPNQASPNQPGAPGKPDAAQPQPSASDAEQARRDVNATLQPKAQDATGDAGNATPPLTEKQIAQEQWLRSIPDDPGGLLRRKFLIEHMMRQRDAKP
ncbi:tetratricopeptide repeat protein [Rhodoferax sp.]|uniref:tetratricopeptide repeat protein n=1 Tax=Rhodoferax sp. TaxID=50421 RepID=UPI002845C12F|nr:tetratricopeptide repeat protein [Rhodoferax sp.]MDR3370989.1 tetratricopeptide repeat protein [Rhodoferax sp.]